MTDEKNLQGGEENLSSEQITENKDMKEDVSANVDSAQEAVNVDSVAEAKSAEEQSGTETPVHTPDPARYAFHWDYRTEQEREKKEKKMLHVRASTFYGLMVGAIFAVAFVLLLVVLLVGENRVVLGGGTVSGAVERVVYVNGDGDAEEALAVEAAVAKMLPSSVSILVSNETGSGVGSGFVLSSDGYIATNHHVIDGKTSIVVRLYGGKRYPATVVGADEVSDLALLKIDATDLTPATFGNSADLLIGETVMAIGTPTGITYAETVTKGIVSCKTRPIKAYNANGTLAYTLLMVQTDASVNPGNSGGPLIDRNGEVIGVIANKTIFNENGSVYYADGMGLAIPANTAKQILEDLKNGKEPDRTDFLIPAARLGVSGQNVTKGNAYAATGVLVTGFSGALFDAAEKLAVNDIIVAINGVKTTTIADVLTVLEDFAPGAMVSVTVYRGGAETTLDVILGSDALVESN